MSDGAVSRYVSRLGPTWVVGAIAAGPATMASLLAAGAGYGYTLLWVVIASAILGALGQYLAARLGLLSGLGLVEAVDTHLGRWWAWILVIDVVLAAGLAQLIIMRTVADVSATLAGDGLLGDPRVWGVVWALVLAIGLAGAGYRFVEIGAKVIVSGVVLAFMASLFVVPIDPGAAAAGLVPRLPAELGGAMVAAAVLGGAVHMTLLTMQSYTMRARDWGPGDLSLARVDIGSSMIVAFGLYSFAIFVVAAGVFAAAPIPAAELSPLVAAEALGPLVGEHATVLFLIGLWGAAISTLGANTTVPPYVVADKLGWEQTIADGRYRIALVATALLSGTGAFIEGALFPLLVLVLAFGLLGTPFVIALILILLRIPDAVEEPTGTPLLAGGMIVFAVATVLAGSTIHEQLQVATGPLAAFMIAFATFMAIATGALIITGLRQR